MVHPLIHNDKRSLKLTQMGYGVLCQHADAVACDELRDTVVDFRVHMVWAACEHDSATSGVLHVVEHLLALSLYLKPRHGKLFPAGGNCITNL